MVSRRVTPAGMLVLSACLAGGVFGIDARSTLGLQIASFSFALLCVAACSALFFRPRISVSRQLPAHATVGSPVSYVVTVHNHQPRPFSGLFIKERLSDRLPSYDEFMSTVEPGRGKRNFFDRRVGHPRWAWLVRRGRGATVEESCIETLQALSSVRVTVQLTPNRRGRVRLHSLDLSRPDPFGLLRAIRQVGKAQSLLVLPKRYQVDWHETSGAQRQRAGGELTALASGESDEFSTVREYRPGDPLRHIHWRSWARMGEPIVKVFQSRSFVRQAVLLDTFSASGPSEQFEEAVSIAASFAYRTNAPSAAAELCFVANHSTYSGRSADSTEMLEALAGVEPCTRYEFSALTELALSEATNFGSCVCVFLEWDKQRRRLVELLLASGIPVSVFVVCADTPPEFEAGPLREQPERLCFVERGGAELALVRFKPTSAAA